MYGCVGGGGGGVVLGFSSALWEISKESGR